MSSPAPLVVYVDIKSPYAFLAKDPTWALADELGIEVDWRPLVLDIPSYLGSARLGERGEVVESQRTPRQWARVKYAYYDARRYASLRGLVLRGTTKIWDSSLAAIGLLWAKAQGTDVLRAWMDLVFERFWKRELDIEDVATIERTLDEAGARTAGFRSYAAGEGLAEQEGIQRAAYDAGIFGVPTYVASGETFFGREHLPRVRWLLGGRRGAAPDVAYEGAPDDRWPGKGGVATSGSTPAETTARLAVAIDFRSPEAWLAIPPTCALADATGIPLDWQPFRVSPPRPVLPPSPEDDRGTCHRRDRAAYEARDVARYAVALQLDVGKLDSGADSTPAAIGLLWTGREAPSRVRDYVERVFALQGQGKLRIDDAGSIDAVLAEIGAPVEGFDAFVAGTGREALDAMEAELREAGVIEVPAYLVDGEVFHGRQHLPLITQLLTEGAGSEPSR